MLQKFIAKQIRDGKHLFKIGLLTALGQIFGRGLGLKALERVCLDARITIAFRREQIEKAERLLLRYVERHHLTSGLLNRYLALVSKGTALHFEAFAAARTITSDQAFMLRVSRLMAISSHDQVLTILNDEPDRDATRKFVLKTKRQILHQNKDHRAIAETILDYLGRTAEETNIPFAISAAASAEAVNREDLFAPAICKLIKDIQRIANDQHLLKREWKNAFLGSLTIFDLKGAERILQSAKDIGKDTSTREAELQDILHDFEGLTTDLQAAHQNVIDRSRGLLLSPDDERDAIVVIPAAGLRKNAIDYPGFRSDIRFATASILRTLKRKGIPYEVRGRIRTHGELSFDKPFFSYHTISQSGLGLHFKETDRPALFSFDEAGYAGWSNFSYQDVTAAVDPSAARSFFEEDRDNVIGNRISKYAQLDLEEKLPQPFVFVPLQVVGDAVSALAYITPIAMLNEIVDACSTLGLNVVVKRHPQCRSVELAGLVSRLEDQGRVTVAYGNIHDIIEKSEAVCVVNSGVGAEALLHAKPVFIFGRADYMAACHQCQMKGDFLRQAENLTPKLSQTQLHQFWYSYRNTYACNLTNIEAEDWIANRVNRHLGTCRR
ncbi:hypothetical protein [Rhizobium halophytocola]|uniref:Capsular biosynthesis protein n=1 Tax=Rhizobium halophytocola TaxID=735519 RepID=A0ABS4E2C9_9HYPH|nr:hypothetical protein [Rhizobium halophytocola]MBP1852091.1 hypothetical protein [Rhizobium halophytocola]